jgi:3-oxoacyl-[acyl-carrier protein] reductase
VLALVTGAASGIGRAIVEALLEDGADVIAADIAPVRRKKRLRAVAMDVRSESSVESAFQEALPKGKALDALVNNAGVFDERSLLALDEARWREMLEVNLIGAARCTRAGVKRMSPKRGGRIVNIASIAANLASPGSSHYAASKAGLVALTRSAAVELAPWKITVNAVLPGLVETPMTRGRSAVKRLATARVPAARIAGAEEVAELVCFLLRAKTDYITGASLVIDGGLSLV